MTKQDLAKRLLEAATLLVAETELVDFDEFKEMIKDKPGDEEAEHDYIDQETGEVLWEEGFPASETEFHPDAIASGKAKIEEERRLWREEEARYKREREEEANAQVAIREAFEKAAVEFAKGLDARDFDASPEDAAGDIASNFFFQDYPTNTWQRELKMSERAMKDYVTDIVYEELSK